jgi:hypothetical protein
MKQLRRWPRLLVVLGLAACQTPMVARQEAQLDPPLQALASSVATWGAPSPQGEQVPESAPVQEGYVQLSLPVSEAYTSEADELADVAAKLNNPVGPLWMLFTQNDYTTYGGDAVTGSTQARVNSLKLNPVLPLPISEDWNLILRPVIQHVSGQYPDPDTGAIQDETGMGDSVLLAAFSPEKTSEGVVWGVGPTMILPTASGDKGSDRWAAGPGGTVFYLGDTWVTGVVAQQWWDFGGDGSRAGINRMDLQYVLRYRITPTFQIGMTPNIIADWEADSDERWTVPVGLGFDQTIKIGDMPVRIGLEYQRYVHTPDTFSARSNVRFFFIPVIANPFARDAR